MIIIEQYIKLLNGIEKYLNSTVFIKKKLYICVFFVSFVLSVFFCIMKSMENKIFLISLVVFVTCAVLFVMDLVGIMWMQIKEARWRYEMKKRNAELLLLKDAWEELVNRNEEDYTRTYMEIIKNLSYLDAVILRALYNENQLPSKISQVTLENMRRLGLIQTQYVIYDNHSEKLTGFEVMTRGFIKECEPYLTELGKSFMNAVVGCKK